MKFNGKFTCWTYLKLKDEVKKLPKGSFYIIKILHKVSKPNPDLRNLGVKKMEIEFFGSTSACEVFGEVLTEYSVMVHVMYKVDMKH
jgi:hypothetical protein